MTAGERRILEVLKDAEQGVIEGKASSTPQPSSFCCYAR
jgi:hypothetical protein